MFHFVGEKDGVAIACEIAKKEIETKIMGMESHETQRTEESDENRIRTTNQNELLDHLESAEHLSSLNAWIDDIKQQVQGIVAESDDGDRDNLMYNPKFAKHFLRLCKLVPLWWGVSCPIFASPSVTSSSANVESYFNDLKHRSMKDLIPCSSDVFVQNHMDAIDDAVITASRLYAKPIEPIAPRKEIDSITKVATKGPNVADDDYYDEEQFYDDYGVEKRTNSSRPKKAINKTVTTCIACKDGNFPSGAHTCIGCNKKVHALDGCSIPYDSEEGFGSKRVCIECRERYESRAQAKAAQLETQNRSDEQDDSAIQRELDEQDDSNIQHEPEAQVAKEMQYEGEWGKKSKTKQSKYMQPNPMYNLMSDTKKQAIHLLKNGNQYTRPFKVGKETVQLFNTCAPDSLAQAIAGAYAYNPTVRDFYESQPDTIVKIAISLAKK